MRSALVLLIVLGACGRIGFDSRAGDGGGSDSDGDAGSGDPLVPLALPAGGQLRKVAVEPIDNSWYVASVSGRIFRLLTGEGEFHPCAEVPGAVSGVSVRAGVVYATGVGTYASTDHCATWQSLPVGEFTYGIADVAGTVVAMTDKDLRRQNGAAWDVIAGPPAFAQYRYFSSRGGAQPLYLFGTRGFGVVATTNGTTWTNTSTNFMSVNTSGVAVGATKTYAITEPNGTNVSDVVVGDVNATAFTSNYNVGGTAIAVDPADSNHVLAAIYDNLGETFNGFTSTPTNGRRNDAGMPDALIFDILFTQDRQVLLATNLGLYRAAPSPPADLAFSLSSDGLDAWEANSIVRDGNDVLIPTDGGLLVSRDGGAFEIHTDGTDTNTAFSSVIAVNGELWGTGRGIWHSVDHGQSWDDPFYFDGTDGYYGLSLAEHGGTIFVGTRNAIRYASAPYTTWATRALPGGNATVDAMFVIGTELWVGTANGKLFESTNDGASFSTISGTVGDVHAITALPTGELLVGTFNGLYTSDASRTTFTAIAEVTDSVRSIAIDGSDVVIGTSTGVRVSHAGGPYLAVPETTGAGVFGAVLDPGDRSIIYSTYGHGIARAPLP